MLIVSNSPSLFLVKKNLILKVKFIILKEKKNAKNNFQDICYLLSHIL